MKAILFLFVLALTARADAPEVEPALPPPGAPPAAEDVDALTREIGAGLRCPVCQGLSISDSRAEAATMMYDRTRELVAAGYDEDQIRDYWIARYGEWVLLEPEGKHWLVWVAPGMGLGLGLGWLAVVVSRWRKEPDEVPLPSEVGLVERDPYEKRLLDEIDN